MFNVILVAIGGFLGAICRYFTASYIKKKIPSRIPAGTLAVNLIGSFILGLLLGMNIGGEVFLFLGVGFMGAFTTFSTFKLETIELMEDQKKKSAILYMLFTYTGGILLAFAGLILGRI